MAIELTYVFALAADHYRNGFPPDYATERIDQIRALLCEHKPSMSELWLDLVIPAFGQGSGLTRL